MLGYAVRAKLVAENVAQAVPNPEPKRREVPMFGDVGGARAARGRARPAAARRSRSSSPAPGCGPRSGSRSSGATSTSRPACSTSAASTPTAASRSTASRSARCGGIPLRARVVEALEAHPWRLDTLLVYPGDRGGHLNLHDWRRDEWTPALEAAGLAHAVPYAMRHTFASFAIAAGVSLFYLARLMGSSVEQIDRTYGHLLPESEEYLRGLLDAYDRGREASLDAPAPLNARVTGQLSLKVSVKCDEPVR